MKTLIILHGWGSSGKKWQNVKQKIEEEGIRVFAPDLPGFKEETRLDRPWDMNDYVDWLRNFISEQKRLCPKFIEGFFILGHSFGGGLAVKYAARRPEDVSGLILVCAGIVRMKTKKIMILSRLAMFFRRFSFLPGYGLCRKFLYYKVLKSPDYIRAEGHLKETFKNVIAEDLTPLLSKIDKRTLILWGKKDKTTPPRDAHIIHKKLKNSKLEILKNAGHIVYKDVEPEILSEKIIRFIKSNV